MFEDRILGSYTPDNNTANIKQDFTRNQTFTVIKKTQFLCK